MSRLSYISRFLFFVLLFVSPTIVQSSEFIGGDEYIKNRPGVITAKECSDSALLPLLPADGPPLPTSMTPEQINLKKAKGDKFFRNNPEACYGLMHNWNALFEACAKFEIDFNSPCLEIQLPFIPLYYAVVVFNNEQAVSLLLAKGADPKAQSIFNTPNSSNLLGDLVRRCKGYTAECERLARQLVKLGVDINDSAAADSPFLYSVRQYLYTHGQADEKWVHLLLELGAEINREDKEFGANALNLAYERRNEKMIQFLEAKGARRNYIYELKATLFGVLFTFFPPVSH